MKVQEASTEVQEEASHNHFESSTRDRILLVDFGELLKYDMFHLHNQKR